jgi:hypothetical protein
MPLFDSQRGVDALWLFEARALAGMRGPRMHARFVSSPPRRCSEDTNGKRTLCYPFATQLGSTGQDETGRERRLPSILATVWDLGEPAKTEQNGGHLILDGMAAAEGRHQRKQRAERKEHDASHHRHVITRDRKHVGARYIHGLVHRRKRDRGHKPIADRYRCARKAARNRAFFVTFRVLLFPAITSGKLTPRLSTEGCLPEPLETAARSLSAPARYLGRPSPPRKRISGLPKDK